jgi:hypothetical protein
MVTRCLLRRRAGFTRGLPLSAVASVVSLGLDWRRSVGGGPALRERLQQTQRRSVFVFLPAVAEQQRAKTTCLQLQDGSASWISRVVTPVQDPLFRLLPMTATAGQEQVGLYTT